MILISGCNNERMKQTEIENHRERITEKEGITGTEGITDRKAEKEFDKELVFKFPKEDIQSLFVYAYDFEGNTTTSNWVYEKEDMTDFTNYLKNLSGKKINNINPDNLSGLFYGVELSGGYPYTLLLAGEYAMNIFS